MEEKSQGSVEYLLILAAALTVLSGIIYLLYSSSTGLGTDVQTRIEDVKESVIEILT